MGLLASVAVLILGHTIIAAEVSFRTLLFLSFMQSQAIAGMSSVSFPPIVQSWTSMFQWTMGIVKEATLQPFCTWYQRATGGTPSTLVGETEQSVYMAKRSLAGLGSLVTRSIDTTKGGTEQTVRGIERVGYRANIERTNIFMTGYSFFYFVTILTILIILLLGLGLPFMPKRVNNPKRIVEAKIGCKALLRGSIYRIASLGYPQMCVICAWELIERYSAAEIVLAITMWLTVTTALAFATFKVIQHAWTYRSMSKLVLDSTCLTQWGFWYTNYRTEAYYFSNVLLIYTIFKGAVTGFSPSNPIVQSILLLILETTMLVATCIIKPFMGQIRQRVLHYCDRTQLLQLHLYARVLRSIRSPSHDDQYSGGTVGSVQCGLHARGADLAVNQLLLRHNTDGADIEIHTPLWQPRIIQNIWCSREPSSHGAATFGKT
ncbi:hypothetical protein BDV36DRAFT_290523 [Aspergillus pseudocaelatus]|uniref:TRP C-terminal domain-containing protein n=1 Tax=Aspergillus pseudocaelatus TaxID=1825620 RepID=A0ABQ6X271_9EURO|nr:hypothetical protein BDV36DRAFT_290523 [Aspergillus pseudocaelatus]